MKFRVANLPPLRWPLVAVAIVGCLALCSAGRSAGHENASLVEDDASILTEGVRLELARELEAYSEATDCWILVKTLSRVTPRRRQAQVFRNVWARWEYPKCAVVLFFVQESTSARMMMSPATENRLTQNEIGAILSGVVVPRFTADDPEGAVLGGVETLRAALDGELEELPTPFRPRGSDRTIGYALIALAAMAFSGSAFQIVMAFKEKNPSPRGSR